MRVSVSIILSVLLAALLTGCGGNSSQSLSRQTRTGKATITITWPVQARSSARSRLVPDASNSIRVEIKNAALSVTAQVLPRPASGGSSSVTFDPLPVGNLTVIATAYPQADGTGTAQATATSALTIQAAQTTSFSLTMASVIDHLEVTLPSASLPVGGTQTAGVAGKDLSGASVLLSTAKLQWNTSSAAFATVDTTGKVTGVAPGSVTISVTDTESQKSASANVTVVSAAPTVTTINLDTWDLKYDAGRNLVYATTSASAPQFPNSVVPINPVTAALGTPIPLDNTPFYLALSGNGQHLYVGGANGTVKRLAMPGGAVEASIALPAGMTPTWMLTLPNTPDSWIIAAQTASGSTQAIVYDGTTPRAGTAAMGQFITLNDAGTRLYGIQRFQSSGSLYYTADISSAGLTNASSRVTEMQGYGIRIQWVNDRMLADNGVIADPDTGQTTGHLTFTTIDHVIGAMPGSNRVYFAAWDPKQIQTYDLPNPTAVSSIPLGTISGGLETATWCSSNRLVVRSFSGSPNTVTIISGLP